MKLVVGLGNPGKEYEATPHNVGFWAIELLTEQLGISGFQDKFHSRLCRVSIAGEPCFLMKPQTYMNRSGLAVAGCARFHKIPPENLVIISDDLDLPPGKARLRTGGGHGGHNGLRSIIESLGSKQFRRIRVGIGRPSGKGEVSGYVLGRWGKNHKILAQNVLELVLKELLRFLETSQFENTSFSVPELLRNGN